MEYTTIDTPTEFLNKTMKIGRGINPIQVTTMDGVKISTVVIDGLKIVIPYNIVPESFIIKDVE